MIVPMKKVSIVVLETTRDESLDVLRDAGVLHIESREVESQQLTELLEKRDKLELAARLLPKSKKKQSVQNSGSLDDSMAAANRILAIADAAGGRLNEELGIRHDKFYCTMAVNESEFRGTVFTAATMEWGHGLYRDNSAVAQITRNVLDRLSR